MYTIGHDGANWVVVDDSGVFMADFLTKQEAQDYIPVLLAKAKNHSRIIHNAMASFDAEFFPAKIKEPGPAPALSDQPDRSETMNLIVWGIARGETESWKECLLAESCKNDGDVEKVIKAATADGFHSFRISIHHDGDMPDFSSAINI